MLIYILLLLASFTAAQEEPGVQLGLQGLPLFESVDRDEYTLGTGDILQVVVEGGLTETMIVSGLSAIGLCQVSSGGIIQISGAGQINVMDMTINQAADALQNLVSRYYPGTRIGIILHQPRTVTVWVSGMVKNSGQYTLYSVNRVNDLVNAASGFSPYSSRTGWMITDTGDSTYVNLHFNLETGEPEHNPFLSGGISVIMDPIKSPIYVTRMGAMALHDSIFTNEVEVWESQPEETLVDFLGRIGGLKGYVDISRSTLLSSGLSSFIWEEDHGFITDTVHAGDSLCLAIYNSGIVVGGAVEHSGVAVYTPGINVQNCITQVGGGTVNADLNGTVLLRNNTVVASGRNSLFVEVLPGDMIEVPYSWASRHYQAIGLLSTIMGITSIIISISSR